MSSKLIKCFICKKEFNPNKLVTVFHPDHYKNNSPSTPSTSLTSSTPSIVEICPTHPGVNSEHNAYLKHIKKINEKLLQNPN